MMELESASHTDEVVKIQQWVQQRTHGTIDNLAVSIVNNVIVLSGRTTTYYSKQLATEAARKTPGELELSNQIDVQGP